MTWSYCWGVPPLKFMTTATNMALLLSMMGLECNPRRASPPAHRLFGLSLPGTDDRVLGREQRRPGTCAAADLVVDVRDVMAHRARRDHELGRDLLVRQPAREQAEHLGFAF